MQTKSHQKLSLISQHVTLNGEVIILSNNYDNASILMVDNQCSSYFL